MAVVEMPKDLKSRLQIRFHLNEAQAASTLSILNTPGFDLSSLSNAADTTLTTTLKIVDFWNGIQDEARPKTDSTVKLPKFRPRNSYYDHAASHAAQHNENAVRTIPASIKIQKESFKTAKLRIDPKPEEIQPPKIPASKLNQNGERKSDDILLEYLKEKVSRPLAANVSAINTITIDQAITVIATYTQEGSTAYLAAGRAKIDIDIAFKIYKYLEFRGVERRSVNVVDDTKISSTKPQMVDPVKETSLRSRTAKTNPNNLPCIRTDLQEKVKVTDVIFQHFKKKVDQKAAMDISIMFSIKTEQAIAAIAVYMIDRTTADEIVARAKITPIRASAIFDYMPRLRIKRYEIRTDGATEEAKSADTRIAVKLSADFNVPEEKAARFLDMYIKNVKDFVMASRLELSLNKILKMMGGAEYLLSKKQK